ncbi:Ankyrin repeat domain-containing protein 16 [Paragonimus heterotremus]|uniref:Ankyrin repeat domain-containing protein 16 n=1 Tax=Paragonimus heterotremus TaxID=100268 RepID=A0A8J4WTH6_9TREM|nr:Ankyrin repeat domain-containing protein 16 [Paragonimus heterotremus]
MQDETVCECLKKLFKAVELDDEQEFVKLYTKVSFDDRLFIWRGRKSRYCNKSDTLIHVAARLGRAWLLRLAVHDGAPLSLASIHNKHPLHEAAQTGAVECLRILICAVNVPVDPLKRADWTPLMLACAASSLQPITGINDTSHATSRFVECVRLLLQHGADPSFTNKDGWNCLHVAARAGCGEIVSVLLQHSPELIHTKTSNGRTCLHCLTSCQMSATDPYESCKIAQNLLDRFPQLLFIPDACGTIPVFDALRRGNVILASGLLRIDPDKQLEHCDKLGLKAVHVVAESGELDSLKLIEKCLGSGTFESKVALDCVAGIGGVTPLHLACRSGQHNIVKHILDAFRNSSVCDRSLQSLICALDIRGCSPMWYAAVGSASLGGTSVTQRICCLKLLFDALLAIPHDPETCSFISDHVLSILSCVSNASIHQILENFVDLLHCN